MPVEASGELPIVSERLLDALPDAVVAEQHKERQGGEEEDSSAYDRDDAVQRRLDIEAHLPSPEPASCYRIYATHLLRTVTR